MTRTISPLRTFVGHFNTYGALSHWEDMNPARPGVDARFSGVRLVVSWYSGRSVIRSDVLSQVAQALTAGTDWFFTRGSQWLIDPAKLCAALKLNDIDWLAGPPVVLEPDFTPPHSDDRRSIVTLSLVAPQSAQATAYDIAIVCALHERELDNILETGEKPWRPCHVDDDPTTYYETTYPRQNGRPLRVIAAAASQMGMPASSVLATKMILHFKPSLLAMVGIAAGADSNKQSIGDILAPDTTFDYGAGKLISNGDGIKLLPDAKPHAVEARIINRLLDWQRQQRHLDSIRKAWRADKPKTTLDIHIGPLGSGSAVLDSTKPLSEVTAHWRKLIGIDMEAHGVHLACQTASSPKPWFLCMKSISDFATRKTDTWGAYASFTAAELFYKFVTEEWETLSPPSLAGQSAKPVQTTNPVPPPSRGTPSNPVQTPNSVPTSSPTAELEDLVLEVVDEFASGLVDSDEFITGLMAETNASGYRLDGLDVIDAGPLELHTARIPFTIRAHFSGEQEEDHIACGQAITATIAGSLEFDGTEWCVTDRYRIIEADIDGYNDAEEVERDE